MSIKMVPQAERSPRWLERDEVYALLREVDADIRLAKAKKLTPSAELATRNAAIFSLLLHGLRVSEVCALHLEDVTIKDKSGKVIVHAGKANKYREVPINVDARQTVSEWLQVRPKDSGSYLFTGRKFSLGPFSGFWINWRDEPDSIRPRSPHMLAGTRLARIWLMSASRWTGWPC
jgi:integrase